MRVGIANPFAYRPHVAHMAFIDRQLRRLGHRTFFLGCGGRLDNCASRVTKRGIAQRLECVKCRAGSIRSYLDVRPARIDREVSVDAAELELGRQWAYSTACTALQIEHESQTRDADFKAVCADLAAATARAYANTRRWIRDNELDCVFLFNGRFELTRAILEACVKESIRFVSVERSWFGDGLQLLPQEGCLGLRTFLDFGSRWAERPLTHEQAVRASGLIGRRLNRTSHGEWLQYNVGARAPEHGEIKYLLVPSSQHEWLGDPDRACAWEHPTQGIECLFERAGLRLSELVVRAHPGWAMKFKNYGANRADDFYRNWCRSVGADYIEPSAQVDTHGLLRRARVVLLTASSAALEAAWLGKPVISLVPSAYTSSGICTNLFAPAEVERLDASALQALLHPRDDEGDRVARCQRALRFIYCANFRLMQFVESLRADSPFAFRTIDPPDLSGLELLVTRGVLPDADDRYAADDADERRVAMEVVNGRGDRIGVGAADAEQSATFLPLRRRSGYRLIDLLTN